MSEDKDNNGISREKEKQKDMKYSDVEYTDYYIEKLKERPKFRSPEELSEALARGLKSILEDEEIAKGLLKSTRENMQKLLTCAELSFTLIRESELEEGEVLLTPIRCRKCKSEDFNAQLQETTKSIKFQMFCSECLSIEKTYVVIDKEEFKNLIPQKEENDKDGS